MDFPIDDLCVRIRAVVLDDNQGDLDLTCNLLRAAATPGIDVVPFGDVELAAAELANQEPDVILLDSSLESCTGVEFLERVRAMGVTAPAILLASRGDEELAMAARHAGFLDCLSKSTLSEQTLNGAIENAVEKQTLAARAESYRKRLEAAVREMDARMRNVEVFHASLERELRTPLGVARELVSIMVDGLEGSLSMGQQDLLSSVQESCDQLKRCLDSLFDGSRPEIGAPGSGPESEQSGQQSAAQ